LENVTKKIIDLSEEVNTIGLYDYEERQRKELNTIRDYERRQGLSEGLNKVAKNMLKLGMKLEEISKATGLSINQIKML